jgi:hypothetical protein
MEGLKGGPIVEAMGTVHAYVVIDADQGIREILTGGDAATAASWYAELGFRVVEADLAEELAAA